MPVVDFDPGKKVATRGGFDFPKFSLKTDEKARIAIVETPQVEFVHTLNSLVIGEDGKVVSVTKTRKDGGEYTVFKEKFMGRVLCTGDYDTLTANGADPANCVVCDYKAKYSKRLKDAEPRFAMHVIKYKTKPGGFVVADPFSVDVVVWSFTATKWNKLLELMEEHGDIRKIDLTITCTNGDFQQMDILPGGGKAAWLKSQDTKDYVKAALESGRIEDRTKAIGTVKEAQYVKMDLDAISDTWDVAEGRVNVAEEMDESVDLNTAFDNILDEDETVAEEPKAKPKAKPAAKKPEPIEEPVEAEVVEEDDDEDERLDFDDIDDLLGAS